MKERILNILKMHPEIESKNVEINSDFRADLGLDSLVMAEITIEIEDTLDIVFPSNAIDKIRTVADLIDFSQEISQKPCK